MVNCPIRYQSYQDKEKEKNNNMKDKDGFWRYMTGTFSNKKKAIEHMFEMRANN